MNEPWRLPPDWKWLPFKDVAQVASDLVDPAGFPDMPHVAPNHIESETGRLLAYSTVGDDGVTSPKHYFRSGQILYSKIRPYLAKVSLVDFDGLCSADMYPIETDLDARYLKWWMVTREFTRRAAGEQARTILPKINQSALGRLPVPVPSSEEQQRIVDILEDHLSRLDAAERILDTATLRQERLLLSQLTADFRRMRLSGTSFSPIGTLTDTSLGKMLDAKRSLGEPTPYLANINVRWGRFEISTLREVRLTEAERERFSLRSGDVLVCEGGEPGRCAVWQETDSKVAYQKALHRVRVNDQQAILPHFLGLMLREAIQSKRWDGLFTGTTIKHLPQEKLRRIEVPIPKLDAQIAVIQRAEHVDDASRQFTDSLAAITRRSSALRRALLTAAFSGKLTGRHTDQEVIETVVANEQAVVGAG